MFPYLPCYINAVVSARQFDIQEVQPVYGFLLYIINNLRRVFCAEGKINIVVFKTYKILYAFSNLKVV